MAIRLSHCDECPYRGKQKLREIIEVLEVGARGPAKHPRLLCSWDLENCNAEDMRECPGWAMNARRLNVA